MPARLLGSELYSSPEQSVLFMPDYIVPELECDSFSSCKLGCLCPLAAVSPLGKISRNDRGHLEPSDYEGGCCVSGELVR